MATVWETPPPKSHSHLMPRERQHVQFTADLIANPLRWARYPGKPKGASGFAKSRSKDMRSVGKFEATQRGQGDAQKSYVRFVPHGAEGNE